MIKHISIIVPAFNEEQVLELFHKECVKVIESMDNKQYSFDFLFINDGSLDETGAILHKLRSTDSRVGYINLSRNFGKEIALIAGLDHVSNKSDAVIIIDADLQHPPSLITELVKSWGFGNQDVYAKRIDRDEGFFKKISITVYYKILNFFTEVEIQHNIGDFRLLDRKVLNAILKLRETQRYNKGLFTWVGFKKDYVNYQVRERKAGETKWSFSKLFDLAIEGITSSTTRPLRIATILGICVSTLAFIWLIKVLAKTIFFGEEISGYPSLIIVVLLLGGIQLLSLGIIGEYLGKIFKETKNRPLYFVSNKEINED